MPARTKPSTITLTRLAHTRVQPTPQGQSLADVADAVFRSAIVLAMYGEALALVMPYLRQRAVVVHVAEQPGHDDMHAYMHAYMRQWAEGLAPQAGTSLVEVTNNIVENIVIDLERLAARDWCAGFCVCRCRLVGRQGQRSGWRGGGAVARAAGLSAPQPAWLDFRPHHSLPRTSASFPRRAQGGCCCRPATSST